MLTTNRVLTIFLAAAVLIVAGITVYVYSTPSPKDKFSEFYILNTDGRAIGYPQQVAAGEPVRLIMGVVNHEKLTLSYRAKLVNDGTEIASYDIGRLPEGGKWEQPVAFTPRVAGTGQIYEFYLYRDESASPHIKDPLVLRLDIK
jgi:uncharacterized membrane protein